MLVMDETWNYSSINNEGVTLSDRENNHRRVIMRSRYRVHSSHTILTSMNSCSPYFLLRFEIAYMKACAA